MRIGMSPSATCVSYPSAVNPVRRRNVADLLYTNNGRRSNRKIGTWYTGKANVCIRGTIDEFPY